MSYKEEVKEIINVTRARLTLSSIETYFFLMSAFATLGMFFKIFQGIGPMYGDLELHEIFAVLGSLSLALTLGILIFLTAMLSIYYDDNFRLENESIYSSNFIFTRLFTPLVRALILFVSLTFLIYALTVF